MSHEWNCNCEDCCYARGGEICSVCGSLVENCMIMNLPKTFTVTCHMNERAIPQFLALLKQMEYLGNIGSSRTIRFYCDGDGGFKPKFIWDDSLPEPCEFLKEQRIT